MTFKGVGSAPPARGRGKLKIVPIRSFVCSSSGRRSSNAEATVIVIDAADSDDDGFLGGLTTQREWKVF